MPEDRTSALSLWGDTPVVALRGDTPVVLLGMAVRATSRVGWEVRGGRQAFLGSLQDCRTSLRPYVYTGLRAKKGAAVGAAQRPARLSKGGLTPWTCPSPLGGGS